MITYNRLETSYVMGIGSIPAMEYLQSLNKKISAKVFSEIELLEKHGFDLREPYVKPIRGKRYKGIYELRTKQSSNIIRTLYFFYRERKFILLHGFTKKTDAIPVNELEQALRYKEDYRRRTDNE